MSRTYSRDDVEIYNGHPSVNVKVNMPFPAEMGRIVRAVRAQERGDERFDYEFVDGTLGDDHADTWFQYACESGFEMAEMDAEEIFSTFYNSYPVRKPQLHLEGRSGGHLVVTNLPPVDEWDAVMLGKWRKFAKWARETADGVPYGMVSDIYLNVFLPWVEERDDMAAEEAAALLPIEGVV